ncbi:Translation initiation factor IF-3 [subsurface metagenome]
MRLIAEDGKQVGVVDLKKALQLARERNLDLIQVTRKVQPPVCKIADLGKYLYQMEKKEKAKKKELKLKEIRLRYNISPHDLEIRARMAEKFLKEGNQVKITMQLRGREKAFENLAREKIELFLETLEKEAPFKTVQTLKRKRGALSVINASRLQKQERF